MIEITIPGRGEFKFNHLVCDVNGTLALDGRLIDGVAAALGGISNRLTIHLVTADTHGTQALIDQQLRLKAVRLKPGDESAQKAAYVHSLGAEGVIAVGQGANDTAMLQAAGLAICVLSNEGAALSSLLAADVVVPGILQAFQLFEKPLRIVATLRK